MKYLGVVVVLTTLCVNQFADSAVWRGVANDINHPDKCVMDKTIIGYGEEYHPPDRCEKIKCLPGGEISGFTCGVKIVDACEDDGLVDISKPYPDCCLKRFICKENGKEKILYV